MRAVLENSGYLRVVYRQLKKSKLTIFNQEDDKSHDRSKDKYLQGEIVKHCYGWVIFDLENVEVRRRLALIEFIWIIVRRNIVSNSQRAVPCFLAVEIRKSPSERR